MTSTSLLKFGLFITLSLFVNISCFATWSIIAVDRNTGEIGMAGASCTFNVDGIGSIIPGKGAIIVQAASNYYARMRGVELMENNADIASILEAMLHPDFEPERQQYAVISIDGNSAPQVYSGTEIKGWSGFVTGKDYSVQGNILVGQEVLQKAVDAFERLKDKPLGERLMAALKAGELAGGDSRCGNQYARSAFIAVFKPGDSTISKLSIYGIEPGGPPAVSLLNKQFQSWKKELY